jgi:hypothetical protein
LLWIAVVMLSVGILIYALDRAGTTYFVPTWLAREAGPAVFGTLGAHLPTFIHPFAFVLITAVALRPWPRLLPAICVGWFVIESAFEFGQRAPLGERIAAMTPAWFADLPVLEAVPAYFARGTFDPLDILSIGLGVIGGYLVVRRVESGGDP